jgi:anti-sigma factor RsiW
MSGAEQRGPDAHPDLETLADLQEGLLPPTPAAAVSGHLGGCASCRADYDALARIPVRLAEAAEVGPAPADLVNRLEEALTSEPRAATVTIMPLASARRNRPARDNRVLQAAAAAVLVLAATAIGVSALQDRSSSTQAGTEADKATAGDAARELSAGSVPVLSTGTNYTPDTVAPAVPGLLASDGPPVLLDERTAARGYAAEDSSRLGAGAALSGCVIALADDPDTTAVEMPTPLVVDIARFTGQPATVIVLPTPQEMDRLDVFVVGADCGPADAKVLHFARVARP